MSKNEEYLFQEIEKRNIDIIELYNSKEYITGTRLLNAIKLIKHFKFITLFKKLFITKKYEYTTPKTQKNSTPSNTVGEFYNKEKKIAVYTCITGNYDDIKPILFKESNCDYYCITDSNNNIRSGDWIIRHIPDDIRKKYNNDTTLINRYYKFHPQELFDNNKYSYSLYIDGNIIITSTISSYINTLNSYGLAFHSHNSRDCIFEEAKICMLTKKGNKQRIKHYVSDIEQEGMPKKYGLLECNAIFTDLTNKKATFILDEWWEVFIKSQCNRDQIILPYVLWKNGIKPSDISTLGSNIYKSATLRVRKHNTK